MQEEETLEEKCARLAKTFIDWLQERNQFVVVPREARLELEPLFAGLEEKNVDLHREQVEAWMQKWLGGLPQEVPCWEYSPELQLSLLGAEPEKLAAPILDVGCGPKAKLVRHLQELGLEAQGLDRGGKGPSVIDGDWLEFTYEPGKWGTIFSHQGFSLHFLHHHLRGGPWPLIYAKKYMEILESLQEGGVFSYVPSLPFIEALLPEGSYSIERIPLPEELRNSFGWVKEIAPDLEVASATRVRRLRAS